MQARATLDVSSSPELNAFIAGRIEIDHFSSASQVVTSVLPALEGTLRAQSESPPLTVPDSNNIPQS